MTDTTDAKPPAEEALAALKKVAQFAKPFVTLQRFVEDIASADQALREAEGRLNLARDAEAASRATAATLDAQINDLRASLSSITVERDARAKAVLDDARAQAEDTISRAKTDADAIRLRANEDSVTLTAQAREAATAREQARAETAALQKKRDELQVEVDALLARFKR